MESGMPVGRCDGHHKMIDFRLEKSSGLGLLHQRLFTRRVSAQFLIKPRHARGFFHWLYIGRQTLAFWHHEGRTPTDGNAVTREAAMAALAKSWRRERLQIDVAWGAGESNLPIKTIQCI